MELRHLRYVIAVAEELHFTRAAERLGIGQPPLSQQIKQLEDALGTQLFLRATRAVALTEAGRAFLPHAYAALNSAEQAMLAASRAARGEIGQLRIGFTSAASFNSYVPAIISRFRDAHPDVELKLMEQATNYLLEALHTDKLDIAFLRPALGQSDDLVTYALPEEPLWIALPSRHPLSNRVRLDLGELANESFVLYPRANGSLLYDTIIAACRSVGFSPRIVQEAPQMTSTVNLVAAGVGVALVPESMRQLHSEGVAYVQITPPTPRALLWVVHRNGDHVPTIVRNFMLHTAQFFGESGLE